MKKVCLAVFSLAVIGYGCGPSLARSPYGQKETQWKEYVKQSYSGWSPPPTIPPVEQQAADERAGTFRRFDGPTVEQIAPLHPDHPVQPLPPLAEIMPIETEPAEPVVSAPPRTYTVKQGDTLGAIARRFYNDAGKWRLILEANQDKVSDPKKLKTGTVLRIPTP